MSDGYQVLSLDEIEPAPYHQRDGQKLLSIQRLLGYEPAGINGWIGDPGDGLVPEHAEDSDSEELYVVVRGRARFTVDGVDVDAPAGTLLHVGPGENRVAVSEEPGTIVVAIGAKIGEAFQNGGWTHFVVADALRRDGRVDEARAVIQELVALAPDVWYTHYNAACFEALAGNSDAAFAQLDQAARINTQEVRKWAAHDTDLDSLREDPRFKKVAG
jgi:quercetin dioxygenase-like cupin family protein